MQSYLSENKINVSIASGSGNLVSFEQRGLSEVIRASVHYFNTEEEIEKFTSILRQMNV